MRRTSGRPLPAGRIDPKNALLFGIVWRSQVLSNWLGVPVLAMETGDFTLASYAGILSA